jgi:hypothetical protein
LFEIAALRGDFYISMLQLQLPRKFVQITIASAQFFDSRDIITADSSFVFKHRRPTSETILQSDGTGSGFGLALMYDRDRHPPIIWLRY